MNRSTELSSNLVGVTECAKLVYQISLLSTLARTYSLSLELASQSFKSQEFEKESIIKVHKASALALCANLNCNNVGERVKQYAIQYAICNMQRCKVIYS